MMRAFIFSVAALLSGCAEHAAAPAQAPVTWVYVVPQPGMLAGPPMVPWWRHGGWGHVVATPGGVSIWVVGAYPGVGMYGVPIAEPRYAPPRSCSCACIPPPRRVVPMHSYAPDYGF